MNNARSGRLEKLESGIKTYLFSIGRNVLLKKYDMKKKESNFEDLPADYETLGMSEYDELFNHKNKLIDKVAELAVNMKEPCKSILKYYYYENLSMDRIAEVMKYKNADTVKSQKLRCMKYLEESLQKEIR
jgi:DNA-directed RNA polymerase specialized sigma24 family protein